MPFVRVPGLSGKVYVPDPATGQGKKHPCPDCHCCQGCGESRCNLCRARPPSTGRRARPACQRGAGGACRRPR